MIEVAKRVWILELNRFWVSLDSVITWFNLLNPSVSCIKWGPTLVPFGPLLKVDGVC